jgi:hypothetical protein
MQRPMSVETTDDVVGNNILPSVVTILVALALGALVLTWLTDGFVNAVLGLLVSGTAALIGLPFVMFSLAWFGNRLPGIDKRRERGKE